MKVDTDTQVPRLTGEVNQGTDPWTVPTPSLGDGGDTEEMESITRVWNSKGRECSRNQAKDVF